MLKKRFLYSSTPISLPSLIAFMMIMHMEVPSSPLPSEYYMIQLENLVLYWNLSFGVDLNPTGLDFNINHGF